MKKYIFIPLFLCFITLVKAQTPITLDTIYANDQKNVALFFPEPIRQGITGSENFIFTYNREKQQYFGLLQAKPGKDSNLLVINQNGSVFSYIVRYKKELTKLNYFIPKSNSIGNEKPVEESISLEKKIASADQNKETHYRKFCEYLMQRKQRIGRIKKKYEGIELNVQNIIFEGEELYFVIEVRNHSSLDFDLNFLTLSIETLKGGKRKSMQRLFKKPLLRYGAPDRIAANTSTKLIYVFPKFSLGENRVGVLELNEKKGERNLKLKIKKRFINHPN